MARPDEGSRREARSCGSLAHKYISLYRLSRKVERNNAPSARTPIRRAIARHLLPQGEKEGARLAAPPLCTAAFSQRRGAP